VKGPMMRREVKCQQPLNTPDVEERLVPLAALSRGWSSRDNRERARRKAASAADMYNGARRNRDEETRVLLTDISVEGRGGREEAHARGSLAHTAVVRIVPTVVALARRHAVAESRCASS
jgi:hypothetical protein